jgi:chitin disaccharide deacetylase
MLTPKRSRKIIVNADDFGMSAETNRAIVEAFGNNVISSATLMTNMPGFDEACELAHRHRLLGKIGLHLNLTSGYPLSSPIRRCPRFCDNVGMFRARQTRFRLSKEERLAVETEIASQIKACLDRGLRPTHLDSHHHVHTEWAIGAAAITIARQYRIKAIRLSRNCGPGIDLVHKFYKIAYNSRLRMYGLAKTRYFGASEDVREILPTASGDVEVMVHFDSDDHCSALQRDELKEKIENWTLTNRLASYG